MSKETLRTQALEARKALSDSDRHELNLRVFERGHKFPAFQLARRVHVYRSTPDEVDTMPFIDYAWGIGKEVVVPVVGPDRTLIHVLVDQRTTWEAGPFGILQPTDCTNTVDAEGLTVSDCIIVPIVAFDRSCMRIGYGGGYYDRFLAQSKAPRIGMAYECQRVLRIPAEPHDIALQAIATEERWYAP
ncbi:MAG: 5-formyltetrahydrofolate cyclo-ligase [Bradyrhizobiaceae bacterium]|nr:5-formyltetrahydrofolate cyclo-ligase [Bradyrhizobiaceae bacterium]